MSENRFPRGFALALLATVMAATFLHAAPVRAEDDPGAAWKKGAQAMSFRFGYARERGDFAPDGNIGGGMGYRQMVSDRLSLGATVDYDLLGKFGAAALVAMPVSLQALWHFHWGPNFTPYAGMGVEAVYRKTYRSGDDHADFEPGYGLFVGADAPVDASHLLGVALRASSVATEGWSENPVFLTRKPKTTLVTAKLTYSLVY